MKDYLWIYRSGPSFPGLVVSFLGDQFPDFYEACLSRFSGVHRLLFAEKGVTLPLDYLPTPAEEARLEDFSIRDWILLSATTLDEETPTSLFLVSRFDPKFCLVLEPKDLEIRYELHGEVAIEEFDVPEAVKDLLEQYELIVPSAGVRKVKPVSLDENLPVPEEESDALDEEALAKATKKTFEAAKKYSFKETNPVLEEKGDEEEPRDVDLSSFKASFHGNAKPRHIGGVPYKQKEETSPEPSPVDWKSMQGGFASSKNEKPKTLRDEPEQEVEEEPAPTDWASLKGGFESPRKQKPKTISRPVKETKEEAKTNEEKEPETVDWKSLKGSFSSDAKPKTSKKEKAPAPKETYLPCPFFLFLSTRPDFCSLYSLEHPRGLFPAIEKTVEEALATLPSLSLHPDALFTPGPVPSGDPFLLSLEAFRFTDWKLLAAYANSYGGVDTALLCKVDDPKTCITVAIGPDEAKVLRVSLSSGATFLDQGDTSFSHLLQLAFPGRFQGEEDAKKGE